MPRADLRRHFERIDKLRSEINLFVPQTAKGIEEFRADLAGLLVVAMAASYEACVKDTIVEYASRHNFRFGTFAANQYGRLSSRINLSDLHRYATVCDDKINSCFKNILKERVSRVEEVTGKRIDKSYENILSWRHDFAHAGIRNTTIEEAEITHRLGRWVLYCFSDAFERF